MVSFLRVKKSHHHNHRYSVKKGLCYTDTLHFPYCYVRSLNIAHFFSCTNLKLKWKHNIYFGESCYSEEIWEWYLYLVVMMMKLWEELRVWRKMEKNYVGFFLGFFTLFLFQMFFHVVFSTCHRHHNSLKESPIL